MAFERPFIDGFDHYTTATMTTKWESSNPGTFITLSTDKARTGSQSLRTANSGRWVQRGFGQAYRTVVAGFAFNPSKEGNESSTLTSPSHGMLFFTSSNNTEFRVGYSSTNVLYVDARASSGFSSRQATGVTTVPVDQWSYIEVRIYGHASAGEIEVRINGVTDILATGLAMPNTSFNLIGVVIGSPGGTSGVYHYDDFYVRGATTLEPGGFLGDCKVLTRLPQGPSSAAQLTSSSGNPNWQNVNTALPDLNTYNHSLTPGDKDLYDFAALADPGAIRAVQLNLLANKTDAGLRLIVPRIKSGATEEAGTAQALSTDNRYHTRSWEVDPATGAAWEHAALDNAEFGASVDE